MCSWRQEFLHCVIWVGSNNILSVQGCYLLNTTPVRSLQPDVYCILRWLQNSWHQSTPMTRYHSHTKGRINADKTMNTCTALRNTKCGERPRLALIGPALGAPKITSAVVGETIEMFMPETKST